MVKAREQGFCIEEGKGGQTSAIVSTIKRISLFFSYSNQVLDFSSPTKMLFSWSLTMSTLQNSRGYISIFIFKTYQHHSSWWITSSSVRLSLVGFWDTILSWVSTYFSGQHSFSLAEFPASFCSHNIGVLQGSTFWTLCSLSKRVSLFNTVKLRFLS